MYNERLHFSCLTMWMSLWSEPKLGRQANKQRQCLSLSDHIVADYPHLTLEHRHCTTAWYADWAFTWTHPSLITTMKRFRTGNYFPPSRAKPEESLTGLRTCPPQFFSSSSFPSRNDLLQQQSGEVLVWKEGLPFVAERVLSSAPSL